VKPSSYETCHLRLQGKAFSSYSAQQLHLFFQLTLPVFGLLFLSFHLYTITPERSLYSPTIPWWGGDRENNPFSPAQNVASIRLPYKNGRQGTPLVSWWGGICIVAYLWCGHWKSRQLGNYLCQDKEYCTLSSASWFGLEWYVVLFHQFLKWPDF